MYLYRNKSRIGVYDLQTNHQVGQVVLSGDMKQYVGALGEMYELCHFKIHRGNLESYWQKQKMIALKKHASMTPILAQIAAFPVESGGLGLLKIAQG